MTTIKLRRDTAANWTSTNPVLALGEPGVETDTRKVKYGDGTTAWTSLAYSAGDINFSGNYNDLTNKPTIPSAQIQSDWTQSDNTQKDFIKNKPALFSGSYNDLTSKPSLFSGSYADLTSKPTIPTDVSDLTDTTSLLGGGSGVGTLDSVTDSGSTTTNGITVGSVTLTNGAVIKDTAYNAVAFGLDAGKTNQGLQAVGIGINAGYTDQGVSAVAIGTAAGQTTQGNESVAIGLQAGKTTQGIRAVAIGKEAGQTSQGFNSIAIGGGAGGNTQGNHSIAIGGDAGHGTQGADAVAIGFKAGNDTQGTESIAIGKHAGYTNQANNSIIINATGSALDQTTANTFTVAPIRNASGTDGVLQYNTATKEVSYSNEITVNSNTWTFGTDGTLTLPSGAGFARGDNGQLKTNDGTTQSLDFRDTSGRGFYTNGDGFSLRGNGSNTWQFGTDGKLTAPGNLQVDGGKIIVHPYGASYIESVGYGTSDPTSSLNIFAGPDQKIKLRAGFGTEAFWTFGTDGTLTLPTNTSTINYANGTSILDNLSSGGIALTDLSIGTDNSASGSGNISYVNTTGVFTYTPPVIPTDIANLADATSLLFDGAYSSLSGTPTIPTATSNLINDSGFITSSAIPTPTLDNASAGDMDVMIYDGNFKYTSKVTIDASTGHLKTAGDITVQGDLNVTGTYNTVNQSTLNITAHEIVLNDGTTGTPSFNASLVVDRGSSPNTSIRWNEIGGKWQQTRDGSAYVNIPVNTTELSEGTNLYYTEARANTAFDNKLATKTTDNVTEGSTNIYFTTARSNTAFDNRLAIKTTTNLTEGTNLYYTDARANTAFDNRLATKSTSNVSEGTNLYYTTARANSAMAAFTGNLTAGNASLGNLVTANYFTGTLTTAAQPNITSVGTLTSLTSGTHTVSANANIAMSGSLSQIAGGNLVSASYLTGTLTTAAQPNITSVGTLSSLIVTANANVGNINSIGVANITGNANVGNLGTSGLIIATGNITGGNLITAGLANVTGNITGGNINSGGVANITGNVTGANLIAGSSGTGNVYAGNIIVNGQPTTYGVANLTTGVVAVQATATGTVSTNYIATTRTGSGQTFTGAGDVILNTTDRSVGSSVAYNTSTGVYTLTAGTTYELSFTPSWSFSGVSNDPYVQYDWVDATANTALDGNSGSFCTAYSYNYNYAQKNYNIISKLVYTPSTNQTVKVRVTATQSGGITTTLDTNSSAYVKAITATFALNALDTMTTTGNVSVGGNLTVTGNISSAGLIWTISASGTSDYVFSGPGIVAGNTNDPVLYLYRGFTYTFVNTTTTSHPFAIRVSNGGSAYTAGITGSQTGTQTFIVPMNAPSTLYYQCTIHSGMGNTINIV